MIRARTVKPITVILVAITLTVCCSVVGQQYPTPQMLEGTWTFVEAPSIDGMSNDIKQELAASPTLQNHVSTYYSGRQMRFYPNGDFSIVFSNGLNFNGQWSLSGNVLFTTMDDGSSASQQIVFVNNVHFYIVSQDFSNPEARLLFPELHFAKN